LKGRDRLGDFSVDGKMMLKLISKEIAREGVD